MNLSYLSVKYDREKECFDVLNAQGYWIAWAKVVVLNGTLQLMSTAAPLTDNERSELALKIGAMLGGRRVKP